MNTKKSLVFLLPFGLFLAALTILPTAQGQLVYTNGFETNQGYFTNGGTGGFGSIAAQGSPAWSATLSGGTSLIVTNSKGTNSTTMTPPQGEQMLQTQYGTSSLSVQQNFLALSNAIKESFNFSFQLAVQEDNVSNAGVYVGMKSSAVSSGGMDFGLLRYTNGGTSVYGFTARQSDPGGGAYATRIGTNTVTLNEFYTFDLTLDWGTLTYNGLVYDSNNNLVTSFTNVAIWDKDGVMGANGFNRVGLYVHQKGTLPYVLLDDMAVTLVGDYYWAPGSGGGGTGTWSTNDANWAAMGGTKGTNMQSEYGTLIFGNTAGDVTVDGTADVVKGLRFATDGYTITGDDVSLNGNGIGYNTIRTDTGVTATINSKLIGTNGFTKAGSGTLVLGGANDYTGGTAVFEGKLVGTTTSLQGDIDNNAALTFSQTTNGSYSGAISGGGTLDKVGVGTVTFAGASTNTLSGKTTVGGGTLELAKAGGAAAISGNLEIQTGAKLLVSASNQVADTSAVTLSGGTIERASGVSETFGNLNLTADSFLNYGTGDTGALAFGTYTPSSLLTVSNFLGGNTLVFKTDLSSTVTNGSYFSFDNAFNFDWDNGTSTFTITAIPEPSTCAAAAGLMGLMVWSLRRRMIDARHRLMFRKFSLIRLLKDTMKTTSHKCLRPMGWMTSVAFIALAGMFLLPNAMGQLIYTNGFETNQNYFTNGGTGGTGTIGGQGSDGGDVQNWTTSLNGGTAQIVTESTGTNSTTMTPIGGDQMLQAQYGTSSLGLNQVILPTNNAIKQDFNLTFKFAVQEDNVSNAGIYVGIRSQAAASASHPNGMDFGVLRYVDGGTNVYGFAARQSTPGGPSYATRIGTNTMNINEWHTFSLDLDWDSLTFSGTVTDSSNNLITSFTNVAIWDRDDEVKNYGFNQLGITVHQKGNQPYVLLDDMSVTLVPEPSTFALVLMGAAAAVYYRRRAGAAKR